MQSDNLGVTEKEIQNHYDSSEYNPSYVTQHMVVIEETPDERRKRYIREIKQEKVRDLREQKVREAKDTLYNSMDSYMDEKRREFNSTPVEKVSSWKPKIFRAKAPSFNEGKAEKDWRAMINSGSNEELTRLSKFVKDWEGRPSGLVSTVKYKLVEPVKPAALSATNRDPSTGDVGSGDAGNGDPSIGDVSNGDVGNGDVGNGDPSTGDAGNEDAGILNGGRRTRARKSKAKAKTRKGKARKSKSKRTRKH